MAPGPKSCQKKSKKHHSVEYKAKIESYFELGMFPAQISRLLNVSVDSISALRKRYLKFGTLSRRSGSGRPKKLQDEVIEL